MMTLSDGPYDQVAIVSRVRLARNCTEFAFSHRLEKADAIRLLARSERVFRNASAESGAPFGVDSSNSLERSFLSSDENCGTTINHTDHFRIWAMAAGLDLAPCLRQARLIETQLEKDFPFAVSLEWGYLSPQLSNLGTAMRASVLLHLPALGQEMASQTLAAAMDGASDSQGLGLVPWGPSGSRLFRLVNRETLGLSEDHLLNKLDRAALVLLHYEKDLAIKLRQQGRSAYDDNAWRAIGVLRNCRRISRDEALQLLASVRLGLLSDTYDKGESAEIVPRQINQAIIAMVDPAGGGEFELEKRADLLRRIFA